MECNDNHGLSLSLIQNVLRCTLQTLVIFESLRIAHCDIKPENIMQVSQNSNDFKLIDYGLCSSVDNPLVTCIQSLFYRSPEVLFDLGFTWKADIWSLGCVAAELFFGIPLFPSESKTHLIYLIDITLGHYPLNFVQKISGPIRNRYFLKSGELKPIKTLRNENDEEFDDGNPFFYKDMEMNILTYNCTGAKQISEDEIENRKLLADLLKMMLKIDPDERCNAESALKHPFFERNLS
ncbi:CMGC family protein kinase [Histomonas meleagridis]|uniref:CMGC family protein kinase n=1 Tax=Histomonas meleagridis TaxID=135588 RepID=UPI003559BA0D|nr:CMGC family protein kinase [Histomonas meleagridis]KAH0797021.1 CMGC family protein kinase [Histomonas meleagridis]